MRKNVWTISNILSASRIVLMLPVILFFFSSVAHNREYAVLVILLAVTTDALDGYIARLLHQESEIGRIIDPLADKIGVGIVVVLLLIFGDIPLWYAALILLRDAVIFVGGIIVKLRKGVVLPSNMPGKFAVAIVALTLALAMLHYRIFAVVQSVAFWTSVLLLAWSFATYVARFIRVMKTQNS